MKKEKKVKTEKSGKLGKKCGYLGKKRKEVGQRIKGEVKRLNVGQKVKRYWKKNDFGLGKI